jgi:mono/diheme cytochrome c family protein
MTRLQLGSACSFIIIVMMVSACQESEPPGPSVPGRSEYLFFCGACHGKDGLGSKYLFPPLAGSEWALGDPEIPIRVVLRGLEGKLRLKDMEYMNIMPPLSRRMDDQKVARVLSYVRSAWGNQASIVSPEEVAKVRALTESQKEKYQVSEIEQLRQDLGEK